MSPAAISTTSEPKKPKKRDIMRERVLDAAAHQMNLQGAASIDLSSVSSAVGLTRNAFYYYFKSRRELIYHSYLRANRELAKDLAQANATKLSACEQLRTLITANLAEGRLERTVLHDLKVLEPAEQDAVSSFYRQNVQGVESILAAGVQRGEFKQVNIPIAAQVLLGMMDWARLWYIGTDEGADATASRRKVSTPIIIDILLRGIVTERNFALVNPPDLASVTARDFNAFDIQDISREKRLQLIGTASRLFNQRGIEATSIDDVAAALGATKGAVYHYFENKNQLLMACYERAFELYDQLIEASENFSDNPLDVMLTIMHLNCQAQANRYPPLILQSNPFSLPAKYTQRVLKISHRVQKTRMAAVEQGFCRVDDPAVVDVSVGAYFWVQKWANKNQFVKPRLLADEVCSIYANGISTTQNRSRGQTP